MWVDVVGVGAANFQQRIINALGGRQRKKTVRLKRKCSSYVMHMFRSDRVGELSVRGQDHVAQVACFNEYTAPAKV